MIDASAVVEAGARGGTRLGVDLTVGATPRLWTVTLVACNLVLAAAIILAGCSFTLVDVIFTETSTPALRTVAFETSLHFNTETTMKARR